MFGPSMSSEDFKDEMLKDGLCTECAEHVTGVADKVAKRCVDLINTAHQDHQLIASVGMIEILTSRAMPDYIKAASIICKALHDSRINDAIARRSN